MALPVAHSALPLSLTPFEILMLLVDRPNYPATMLIRIELSGRPQRAALEEAVDVALERNPLLCSLVESSWGNRRWVWAPDKRPKIDWDEAGVPLRLPDGEFIDLRREVGTRIWVRLSDDVTEVIFQLHHACCDGMGFGQFVSDCATGYSLRTGSSEKALELEPLDPSLLRTRGVAGIRRNPKSECRTSFDAVKAMCGILRAWATQVHRPPGQKFRPAPTPEGFPNIMSHAFDRGHSRRIREAARARGATINDVLITELSNTIQAWNEQQSGRSKNPIRILMPTSLRSGADELLPAANVLGFTFLTRDMDDLDPGDEHIDFVRSKTKQILKEDQGWTFDEALQFMSRWKFLWTLGLFVGRRPVATAILTHLGNAVNRITARGDRRNGELILGDVTMTRLTCVPPLRPGTLIACNTFVQSGWLTVNMRCDPRSFTQQQQKTIMQGFVDRIASWGESKETPIPSKVIQAANPQEVGVQETG